jgi:hypothetical protein
MHFPMLCSSPFILLPFVAGVIAAPRLRHRLSPPKSPPPLNSEMMDSFIALSSCAAILLTFSIVQAESAQRHLQDQAGREAGLLNDLDRTIVRYPDQKLLGLRPVVKIFAQALINEEWPLLTQDGRLRRSPREVDRAVRQGVKSWHLQNDPEPAMAHVDVAMWT